MKKRLLGILLSFALVLTMMPVLGLSQTAYADADTWSANKSFDSDAPFPDGVNITENITVTIAEGKTVTVEKGIYAGGKTLTVEGKGNLIVNGSGGGGSAFTGNIIVNGGEVTLTGGTGGEGENDYGGNGIIEGNVVVSGGSFSATGGNGYGNRVDRVGRAVSNTITCENGIVAQESADGSEWSDISDDSSNKQYVRTIQTYPLWVGGTQVNSANADDILGNHTASYVAESNTLTLNGATITEGYYVSDESDSDFGIYYNGSEPLIIDLADGSVNTVKIDWGADNEFGIYVGDQNEHHPGLNISGKGKLTVYGSDYGIYAPNITIDECDVTASGGSGIRSYPGSIEIKGGSVNASATSYAIEAYSDVIINAGSKVTASGVNKAIRGYVKNAIAGTGWTDAEGTEGMTAIEDSTTGQSLTNYKKVQFPAAHTHIFTYTASDATITAICGSDGCTLPDNTATLTITKPQHEVYGDEKDPEAGIIDSDGIKGEATVSYYEAAKSGDAYTKKSETALSGAPTNAGDYIAEITLGADDNTATASVGYTIAQKAVTVSNISAEDKTYDGTTDATLDCTNAAFDGKLDTDTLSVTATGTFADANAGQGKTVNISGLTLGGKDSENYTLAATGQQSTTNATISPKSIAGATVTLDKTQLTYNGQAQSVSVTGVTTSDGMTLTDADYTVSGNTQTDKGDYKVTVTGKGNFTDPATADWKIVAKAMTVKADNVTVTYDGKDHGVTVKVIDPASGAKVNYGTTEGTYNLEESPTIREPGTLTVYYKAEAGANYSDYTGTAVVTVEKAASTAAKVTANDREFDGNENALVSVTGKAEGGEMQYALGNDAKTAPASGWSTTIPKAANAGTYYVWYKVAGDEHHKDTAPVCVTVKISEKPAPPTPSKKTARTVLVAKAISAGNTKAKLSWNNAGADRYVVYYGICGKSMKKYKTVNGKTRSVTVKKLRKGGMYKFRIVAQKKSGKSYKNIATSGYAHMTPGNVSGRYTNVKDLKVNRKAVNLSKGRTFTVKTSLSKVRKNKRLFNLSHDPAVRYITDDPGVAVVNSKGKITAKGKGTCYVYVQAVNGIWKTVKVNVK